MDAVSICNQALDQIAARSSIASIDPPSPPNNLAAQVAARTYQTQMEAVFCGAHWNSARFQKPLTLLKAAQGTPENPDGQTMGIPPAPWSYQYAYPEDCLQVRFVMPRDPRFDLPYGITLMTNMGARHHGRAITSLPFVPAIDHDQEGNEIKTILTHARHAEAVYTGRVHDVNLWGAPLRNAVTATLAAWMTMPLTGDKQLMVMRVQLAVGLITAARLHDGNEGITSSDLPVDWMDVRNQGAWFNDRFGPGPFLASWQAVAMPNGVSY